MRFDDRRDAGQRLATQLARRQLDRPVILALPRGGVPVAAEVAEMLDAPLDVLVVRKLGCPGRPELGIGAVAEDGLRILNHHLIAQVGITPEQIDDIAAVEGAEVMRRVRRYRGDRRAVSFSGRTVIVIDDGLATGYTARAAIEVVRKRGARRTVLAVPVGPAETVEELQALADDVVCLTTPAYFTSIGQAYTDFHQFSDTEVAGLLELHAHVPSTDQSRDPAGRPRVRDVHIPAGGVQLAGTLTVPVGAIGGVVFAHGSGSSRSSPRNVAVARTLSDAGLATLLFDLLEPAEAVDRANVFDIALLSERLEEATRWLQKQPETSHLQIGYFGASTGAAAALRAAGRLRGEIAAVVSRGGRPDLASAHLKAVTAPTLLIVGEHDTPVIELNQNARRELECVNRLEIVPGATHLFAEPGALDRVANLARDWFTTHLTGDPAA